MSLLGALMFVLQVMLSGIGNVHVTAPLIIMAAIFFSWRSLYAVAVFVGLEALVWGLGLWTLSYIYAWPLLAVAAILMRENDAPLIWAVLAGVHGLCFGALCAIPYLFIGGFEMAFSYWLAGIPFDLVHCAGNFVLTALLYKPMRRAMALALKKT